jgi:hypothetical protein
MGFIGISSVGWFLFGSSGLHQHIYNIISRR